MKDFQIDFLALDLFQGGNEGLARAVHVGFEEDSKGLPLFVCNALEKVFQGRARWDGKLVQAQRREALI